MAKLVYFGTAAFSVGPLQALIEAGHDIVAVVTKPDSAAGRSGKPQPPRVKKLALEHNISVLQPTDLSTLEIPDADAGIVVAYGRVIPPALLKRYPAGLINIHASLLPRWRGASPIESALLAGDEATGVTLMQLDEGLDTGPIYTSAELPLSGHETRPQLYEELGVLGTDLLLKSLDGILSGDIKAEPQNEAEASNCGIIKKADGAIKWNQPAIDIERQIRAYLGWPGSRTHLMGKDLVVLEAKLAVGEPAKIGTYRTEDDRLFVRATDGWIEIIKLIPAGKREMSATDFVRGRNNKSLPTED